MTFTFLLISYVIIAIIFFVKPRRLTLQEIYSTWIIISLIVLTSDIVFGDILDLYDLMKKPGPQVSDVFIELTLPACFGILYVNFMPKNNGKFIIYCLSWVVFSVLYEHISRYFGYVNYKGWKVWYSVPYYMFACLFMRWHLWFIRKGNMSK
jgi:hypothetical protein